MELADPSSRYILRRPTYHDYYSERASKSFVEQLFQVCDREHLKCRMSSSRRPKRLLRISKDEKNDQLWIYLDVASQLPPISMATRYSALSYCWGGDQAIKLETASLERCENGLAISELPKTLFDAVQLSWDLGLAYIWIDCLCILQDDETDLAREIADLPAIFGNAYVTISASRASDSREGFLHPVSHPPADSTGFSLPYACPDGTLGSIILNRQIDDPIHDRAWTFQEFMLSPRILDYTSLQLQWICRERTWHHEMKDEHQYHLNESSSSLQSGDRQCETWMMIVWAYSKRTLRFAADKLPAISGLAELWNRERGPFAPSYMAGIWSDHLPSGLLWTNQQRFSTQHHAYRAPSWSWACLDASITWSQTNLTTIDPDFVIQSWSTKLVHDNAPYGAVSYASLTILGRLSRGILPSNIRRDSDDNPPDGINLEGAYVSWDYDNSALHSLMETGVIFCLQIYMFEETKRCGPSGLLLVADNLKKYRRIGVFRFKPPSFTDPERNSKLDGAQRDAAQIFEDTPLETITLV
jgi:hypothetical protein